MAGGMVLFIPWRGGAEPDHPALTCFVTLTRADAFWCVKNLPEFALPKTNRIPSAPRSAITAVNELRDRKTEKQSEQPTRLRV
jgi:hypothetical protein